jgi:restriction endonuclease S subunit
MKAVSKFKETSKKRYDGPIPRGFVLQPGDVVVAMTEQAEGLLGSSAIIPEGDTYLHNQRIGVVTSETLDRRFLFYLFNYKPIRDQISASASGTKVRHTSPTRIGEVWFALPPFDIQRRIADILSAYDELIQVNMCRIAVLEEMARRIFDEWFVKRQFPGHKTAGFAKGRPESSPEYWRAGSLNDVAQLVGTSINPRTMPDRLFRHFSIPSFDSRKLPVVEKGSQILSNKLIFSPPVVLISKLNPRIPRVWRVEGARGAAAICSTEFLPLRPNSEIGTGWLTALCTSEPFIGLVKGLAQGTSTSHQRARPQDVLALPIIIPPLALLQRADGILGDNFDLISTLLNASQKYLKFSDQAIWLSLSVG